MIQKERRLYSDLYQQKIKVFERKYSRAFNNILKSQFSTFAEDLKSHGKQIALHNLQRSIIDKDLGSTLLSLYKEVGLSIAISTTRGIKLNLKSGILGKNPKWIRDIINYFRVKLLNKAVIPITQTTKDQILEVLSKGEQEGWGIDEMASRLKSPDLTLYRAQRIARTETAKAAFVGRKIAVQDIGFEMNKEWISAHDNRVRDAHREADGTIIPEDEQFTVDDELLDGPGDPSGSPENIINCRCTLAFVPKRDKAGRLIPKTIIQQNVNI